MGRISGLFKLENYKDVQPHHHHIILLIIAKILLVIAILIIIKPAFTGFVISKQFEGLNISPSEAIEKQEKLNFQIGGLESRLESCNEDKKRVKGESWAEANSTIKCLKEKSQLEVEMERAKKDFEAELNSNLKKLEADKQEIMEEAGRNKARSEEVGKKFNELAVNSANNICCKLKVDDKAIDSYKITDNRIICGKEEANTISC